MHRTAILLCVWQLAGFVEFNSICSITTTEAHRTGLLRQNQGQRNGTRLTPTALTLRKSGDSALTLSNMDIDQQTQTF
jgi:hypothetical protein